ncbi:hypothetical protein HPB50_026109 [Hyalomma asiaticum]|uniref:Uncharacterized protein n=1 Tax=Hyalomma asiaticum TaxID=266040 RepID=A0ACB7TNJ9_HYAAI|nr:hypothetical protein HPB50_026109 [Hyalomma asiaticum]
MASAALAALSPPPPFLATPGTPAIPWPRWIRLFENFLLASGATDLPAPRRRALLLHCLGPEGQRIFDALPPPPTAPQLPTLPQPVPLKTVAGSPSKMPPRQVFQTSTTRPARRWHDISPAHATFA